MAEQVWRIAKRYRVLGRIGSGGMADVVRAHDELLDRDVAVKVFRTPPSTPDTATGVERQHAELRALARLNHPNLTVLYDGSIVGQDGPAYLVMELIEGGSLAEAIENGGLGVQHTAEVGAQIADALAYVHAAGMVHRDVKPANILLGTDRIADTDFGRARLTDFGIVRLIGDESLTQANMTLGSASYLAPEQTRGSSVGPPADVYALGLSLLEALTGRRSFEGPALEAAMARLTNDPFVPRDLPQPWPGLLHAMTARDPAQRPTAAQVAKALRNTDTTAAALTALPAPAMLDGADNTTAYLPRAAVATGSTTALPPARPPLPPVRPTRPADPPPPRRVPIWVAVLVGLIVLAALIGVIALATSGSGGGGTTPAPSVTPLTSASSTVSHPPSTDRAPSTADTSSTSVSDSPAPTDRTRSTPSSETPSSGGASTSASRGSSSAASTTPSTSASTVAPAGGQASTSPGKVSKTKKPKP